MAGWHSTQATGHLSGRVVVVRRSSSLPVPEDPHSGGVEMGKRAIARGSHSRTIRLNQASEPRLLQL